MASVSFERMVGIKVWTPEFERPKKRDDRTKGGSDLIKKKVKNTAEIEKSATEKIVFSPKSFTNLWTRKS